MSPGLISWSLRTNGRDLIGIWDTLLERLRSWFSPKEFSAKHFRGVMVGINMAAAVGETCAFKLLRQDISAGYLPSYTIDVAFIVLAMLEVLLAPLVAWWGYRTRRPLLIGYTTLTFVIFVSWFFLPASGYREESELCNTANGNDTSFLGVMPSTIARLVLIGLSCLTFMVTRVACWSHGIAYCYEYAPERISVHYAILLAGRTLAMLFGHRLFTNDVDKNMTVQCVWLIVTYVPNLVQMARLLPKNPPLVKGVQKTALPDDDRDFMSSVFRVCSKPLVVSQMVAMGLMVSALFGYMYNEAEIIKVKFNMVPEKSWHANLTELTHYVFVMFVVAFAGNLFAKQMSPELRKASFMRQIIRSTVFAIIFYVVTTFAVRCDLGNIAGLTNDKYENPKCSLSCGCQPRMREFEPVCLSDQLVTYLSPCHAGCAAREDVNGVRVYTQCACSGGARAAAGACSDALCGQARRLHGALLAVVVLFTLLTLHAQGMLLLQSVDARDRSVVMGLSWSMVALVTFVFGHMLFTGISVGTCRWFDFEGKICHLQINNYAYIIGGTSVLLALISLCISSFSAFSLRKTKKTLQDTRL